MTQTNKIPRTCILWLLATATFTPTFAAPPVGPEGPEPSIDVGKILGDCKDAADVAACLRDRVDEEKPSRYPKIPDRSPGLKRVEVPSALLNLLLATEWEGTRIQISHPRHGESVIFGPFEALAVPLYKLKEIHLPAADRECAGVADPGACYEDFFDRFKTERYAERFSFIRWGERVGEEPELLKDPFETFDWRATRFAIRIANLHAVVGETGFAARIVARERAPARTFVPALFLYFEFTSPQTNIICTNSGGFLPLGCPDASLNNVSVAVELLLTLDEGRVTYDTVDARFHSDAPDIRRDADVLDAVVAAFVDLRREIKTEVEKKLLEQFHKQRSRDRVSKAFSEALCRDHDIAEVVALYITPDDSLVIDGVENEECVDDLDA